MFNWMVCVSILWENLMNSFKCTQCGKAFPAEHSLKIHVGKMHQSKAEAKAAAKGGNGRKTRKTRKGATAAGQTTCGICGRSFGLPMHLARHITAKHGRGARAAQAWAGAPEIQVDVTGLNIDQLLALKQTLDARLVDIAQKMKRAKVTL